MSGTVTHRTRTVARFVEHPVQCHGLAADRRIQVAVSVVEQLETTANLAAFVRSRG